MDEFWEKSFQEKGAMWGAAAAVSAVSAAEMFREKEYKEILIPGIGYGRNAGPFIHAGMKVAGIEISETAIHLLRGSFGSSINVFQGSVTEMPFETKTYDGVFSFALLHLLSQPERQNFIQACYEQLKRGGTMIFTSIAETAPMFGTGKKIADRLYETRPGVRLFFYDYQSIREEFGSVGLTNLKTIIEPAHSDSGAPELDFLWIECIKN